VEVVGGGIYKHWVLLLHIIRGCVRCASIDISECVDSAGRVKQVIGDDVAARSS
jgi:hypothetical protein